MSSLSGPSHLQQQIAGLLPTFSEPQRLLTAMAERLSEYLAVPSCIIVAGNLSGRDRRGDCQQLGAIYGPDTELQLGEILSSLDLPDLLTQQKPQIRMIAERQSFCLAARHQGQANGAILVEANRIQGLTPAKQEELPKIAEIIGFALNYLELQQQSRQKQRYQTLIHALMGTMQRGLQGHALLNEALAAVVQSLEADGGAALKIKYQNLRLKILYSQPKPVEGTLEIVSQQPASPASIPGPFSLKDCPLFQQAWAKFSQPLILSGPANLHPLAIADSLGRALGLENQTAVLVVPILGSSSDENKQALVLAALVLWQRETRCWQSEEIELVQWACTQVGTALLQQQTLQSVQSLVNERTSQLRISLDVQAKLSERMRQQIQELSRLNLVKDEFIANLSDALKHPLTKIKMAIEMLKLAPNSNQRQRYLDILQAECTKEIHLVNDLLTLHSLKATPGEVKREKVELNALLEPLSLSFEQQWLDKGVNLERTYWQQLPSGLAPASTLTFYCDPDSLQRILLELLANAGKFSSPNTTVFVQATQQLNGSDRQMTISVTNTGSGLSEEEQESIFEKFQRGKNAPEGTEQGTGLGLALVKSLVLHLGGTITVSSVDLEEALAEVCFTVTLPQM